MFEGLGKNGRRIQASLRLVFQPLSVWQVRSLPVAVLILLCLPWILDSWLAPADLFLLDGSIRLAARWREPSSDLAVVDIDDATLHRLGLGWPLPRARLAGILEAVQAAGPRLVVLDILFQHPETPDTGGDGALARTLARAGNVALISVLGRVRTRDGTEVRQYRSLPGLRRAARLEGFVWGGLDPDRQVRSFVYRDELGDLESLPLLAAREMAGGRLPLAPAGDRGYLAWSRPEAGIPRHAAGDLLAGRLPAGALQGRIVILGTSSEAQGDSHETPMGRMPGCLILATAMDTLVQGRMLRPLPPGPATRLLPVLGSLAALLLYLAAWRRPFLLAVFGSITLAGLSFGVAFHAGFHLPVAGFLLAAGLAASLLAGLETLGEYLQFQEQAQDARLAGQIQESFFPQGTLRFAGEYECHGLCLPYFVAGGDFFDYAVVPDDRLFLCIADVAGHGLSAAMVTAIVKTVVETFKRQTFQLSHLVQSLNRVLLAVLRKERFVTALTALVDGGGHTVSIIHSGHLAPYLRRGPEVVEVFGRSYPLGVLSPARLAPVLNRQVLQPGDFLVFYSDGIVEAMNPQEEPFGFTRVQETLREVPAGSSAEEVSRFLLARVRDFCRGNPPLDDVTIVTLLRRPTSA